MTVPSISNSSEVDHLQSGHIVALSAIEIFANRISGDDIENAKNLAASVTLTEHRDHHLLRHSWFVQC